MYLTLWSIISILVLTLKNQESINLISNNLNFTLSLFISKLNLRRPSLFSASSLFPQPHSSSTSPPVPPPLFHFPFLLLPLNPRRNSPFPLNPRRHSSHLLSTRDGHSPPEPVAAQLHFRLLSTPAAVIHHQNLWRQPFMHHQSQPRPAPPNQQETLQEHVLERIGKSHYLIFLLLYNFCLWL
ncbi:hypothetical protein ACJIZ3_019846 [Penstemon smallii]|uniref:Uncharacterized protein n=1 Tax=Penstemon smallii TaxID=265156 RepID=A0ABD3T2B4_9LAMI